MPGKPYKPSGYTSVAPYLLCDGAARVLDFLTQGLGAKEVLRVDGPMGTILHAEVRIDDTIVMLGDATKEFPALPANLHVYVPDVDQAYAQALQAGATPVRPPTQAGDPDKRGGVKDPAGNVWWLATRVG